MEELEKRLKEAGGTKAYSDFSKDGLEKAIGASKAAFWENQREQPLSSFEFLRIQAGYLKKRWFFLQGGLLLGFLYYILQYPQLSMERKYGDIGSLAPLFAILLVPELWKNLKTQSMEVESAAYFGLKKVYAARFLLMGMADLLMLTAFFVLSAVTAKAQLQELTLQFLIPFNFTSCICFQFLTGKKVHSETAAVAASLLAAAGWHVLRRLEQGRFYQAAARPVWILLLAISAAFLVWSVWKALKRAENSEGQLLWNYD